MAQVVGELEIKLFAELARLRSDMDKANSIVAKSSKSIEKTISSANRALGALGIGLSAGFFANIIKGSIDASDHLNDLSKTTNISVEDLAGLGMAAKQSGTDLDGTAKAIAKLSENMGKDTEKFRLLGVTAEEPLEAFKQLADVYVALEDPQQRSAVMAEALGKSWQSAAPLLAEGGQKIGELVNEGTKLSGMTKENAELADRFNDNIARLKTSIGGLVTSLVGDLLPALIKITDAFARLTSGGSLFENDQRPVIQAQINTLMGFYEAALVSGQQSVAESYRKQIDALMKKIQAVNEKAKGDLGQSASSKKAGSPDQSGAEERAAAFLVDPSAFNKILADMEKATATSQMNILQDEQEKATMRIAIANAEMLAKVDYARLTEAQKKQFDESYAAFSAAKTAEETKKSQGAFMDLMDAWGNTTNQMQQAAAGWASSAADELTTFVTTGKASFRDFANAVIADLIRIGIQQQITGLVGSMFGLGTAAGAITGRAIGGPVVENQPYIVGERGPEMFVPSSSGSVVPQGQSSDTYVIDARSADRAGLDRLEAMIRDLDGSIERRSVFAWVRDRSRGGPTSSYT